MGYRTQYRSPIGVLILESNGTHLLGLWLEGQKFFGQGSVGAVVTGQSCPVLDRAASWLDRYFAGEAPDPKELPLLPQGSEFRRRVWQQLCKIPYGETVTYAQLAKALGCNSAQAIGGAVGHNPISIIIPCHRVLGASGGLTGYAGGLDAKAFLLRHEGIMIP